MRAMPVLMADILPEHSPVYVPKLQKSPLSRYVAREHSAQSSTYVDGQAENIVEIGEISPMDVDLPGIYVDRIVPATVDKQIEFMTLSEDKNAVSDVPVPKDEAKLRREKIAKRASRELKDGYYCNLGVGMPVLAANYTEPGVNVWLQSENGILGMGPYPTKDQVDA